MKKILYYFILFNSFLLSEILPQQITVLIPNGGEDWKAGTEHFITWSSDGISGGVSIDLIDGRNSVTNGTFDTDTDWIKGTGWTISSGKARWDGSPIAVIKSTPTLVIGQRYTVTFKVSNYTGLGAVGIESGQFSDILAYAPGNGTYTFTGTNQRTQLMFYGRATNTYRLDNVSIQKITPITTSPRYTQNDGRKTWKILYDLEGGTEYKVKITSENDPSIFDLSDNNFTITANTVTVTSPNGGENWLFRDTVSVTWSSNFSERVKIELHKGGIYNSTIISSTTNDGQRDWIIPPTLSEGSDYKIKIISVGSDNIFDFSDAEFTLSYDITVTSPNGGESRQADITYQITWTDNISDNVQIDLYKGGSFRSLIKGSTASDGTYNNWFISYDLEGGSDYKVKITSKGDPNLFDFSDADFTIPFKIAVTSPNGGEIFKAGATKTITWSDNISGPVKIDLYKGGTIHSLIKASTASNGSYDWVIPYDLQGDSDFKVLITSLDDPDVFDFSDNNFTIVGNQVTVASPNGGENWLLDTRETITWTDNFSDNVKIELYKGGILHSTVHPNTLSDGSYGWDILASLPEGSDYKIKIFSLGGDNVLDFSDANFTLSHNITVTSPNGGESWQAGTRKTITWTDNISGLVKIELYKAGVLDSLIKDMTDSDGSYGWDIPFDFPEGSDYKVLITSLDDPTLFDDSDDNFTIFLVPEITVISPNGGQAWQTATTQTITWTDNLAENVRIRLNFFGNFITLENSVPSSGSYTWDIPLDFPPNNFYRVGINSVNDTTIEDYSDAEFSIATKAINITSPNGGESWQAGTSHAITSTDNISDDVKFDLYKGGTFHSPIKDTTASDGTYSWNITYNISGGSDYKVKMTSLGNPDVFDFSDNNFTIVGNQLTVTSPNGDESWQTGTTHPITWHDNFSDNVRLQLFKSDTLYSTIRSSTASDSSFTWNIADTIQPGSDYKVKILSLGDSSVFDFSDNNFTLFAQEITITSPNGGENWHLDTREPITWTDNFSANVKIELYKGGTFHSLIVNSTSSDGVRNWDIPASLPEGSDYQIKITRLGSDNVFDFSDSVFSLSNEIAVISPNGSESLQKGTTQTITWFDNLSSAIKIELYKSGTLHLEISASTPNDGSKPWDIPLNMPNGSDYKIKITSINITDFFDFSNADFTINSNDTSVEFISNNIPDEYILFQNYPNPFNPSTKIEFGLVENSSVSLKLYDIMGQEVAVIIDNESFPAGILRYNFIALNLPSGVYIYYLIAKSNVSNKTFSQPKKMVLLK